MDFVGDLNSVPILLGLSNTQIFIINERYPNNYIIIWGYMPHLHEWKILLPLSNVAKLPLYSDTQKKKKTLFLLRVNFGSCTVRLSKRWARQMLLDLSKTECDTRVTPGHVNITLKYYLYYYNIFLWTRARALSSRR